MTSAASYREIKCLINTKVTGQGVLLITYSSYELASGHDQQTGVTCLVGLFCTGNLGLRSVNPHTSRVFIFVIIT